MRRNILRATPWLLILAACQDMPTEVPPGTPITPRFALPPSLTPPAPIMVTSSPVMLNAQAGNQIAARISPDGDLVCYMDDANRQVRYHKFSTGVNAAIPGNSGGTDLNCSTNGSRIGFIRINPTVLERQAYVFDVASAVQTAIDPQPGVLRDEIAIAGNVAALVNVLSSGFTEIRGADVTSPGSSQIISAGTAYQSGIRLSPQGDRLLWNETDVNGNLLPLMSVRTGGTWSAPAPPLGASGNYSVAGTDGTYIVFTGDDDVFIQEIATGDVMQLTMDGFQMAFSIDEGVVGLLHNDGGSDWDVMVYIIAANRLLQVTNTPYHENGPSVSVLANGNIRVVWQALSTDEDILSTAFTPTGGAIGPTFTFGGFRGILAYPALNNVNGKSTVPVRFSLGGNQGSNILVSGSPTSVNVDCSTKNPSGAPTPTQSANGKPPTYDPTTGDYIYLWKTDAAWKNSCREFTMHFITGQVARAVFQF